VNHCSGLGDGKNGSGNQSAKASLNFLRTSSDNQPPTILIPNICNTACVGVSTGHIGGKALATIQPGRADAAKL